MGAKKAKIQKWGNSHAIRLPHDLMEAMNLHSNDEIEIRLEGDALVISRPPPTLKDLIASMGHEKFQEADTGPDTGREVIDE